MSAQTPGRVPLGARVTYTWFDHDNRYKAEFGPMSASGRTKTAALKGLADMITTALTRLGMDQAFARDDDGSATRPRSR